MKTIDIVFSDREYQLFERAAVMTGKPLNEETIGWLTVCGLELWLALAGADPRSDRLEKRGERRPDSVTPLNARCASTLADR